MSNQQLIVHILNIRSGLDRGEYESEAAISDGIVRRILEAVGWPRYDQRIVYPQFPIGSRKVDNALCNPPVQPVVLLEVKTMGGADDKAEQQLFGYCYKEEVEIGVLTDGPTWNLYYPRGEGGFVDRLFCNVNLLDGDENTIADAFVQYLAFDAVTSGEAIERSRTTFVNYQWKRRFTSVRDAMLREPDPELVRLFRKKVNEKWGSRPERQAAMEFLKRQWSEESSKDEAAFEEPLGRPESTVPTTPTEDSVDSTAIFYTLNNETTHCKTGKEVFVGVFREFAQRDATFCERYARTQRTGGKRLELARRAEDLYPPGSKWARTDASHLPGGWCIATHLSNELKEQRIQRACDVLGIQYRRDLIVSLSR